MITIHINILLILSLFCTQSLWARELSWEIGAGMAGFDIPLYAGSAESRQYLIPVPYAKLRSEYLEVDGGVKGFLFSSKNVRLDISADLGVPVRSKDSAIRKGMPNLDTVLQLGPSLEITLAGHRDAEDELRLEFPLRAAIATDIKNVETTGWIFEPRLTFEHRGQGYYQFGQGLEYSATLGLRYATRDYHAYYYDVAPQYVTPSRPVFASEKGYSGLVADIVTSWREGRWQYWVLFRYRNLNSAVFENSPLVEEKDYLLFGVGLTWIFAQSL